MVFARGRYQDRGLMGKKSRAVPFYVWCMGCETSIRTNVRKDGALPRYCPACGQELPSVYDEAEEAGEGKASGLHPQHPSYLGWPESAFSSSGRDGDGTSLAERTARRELLAQVDKQSWLSPLVQLTEEVRVAEEDWEAAGQEMREAEAEFPGGFEEAQRSDRSAYWTRSLTPDAKARLDRYMAAKTIWEQAGRRYYQIRDRLHVLLEEDGFGHIDGVS
jgi:hypothetical protein